MFSLIRSQQILRRAQNARYPITSSKQALTALTTTGRGIHQNANSHSPDSYSKDVDYTPPKDEKIHRVDPESDCVQKPYEAPSGEWSRAGVETDEYSSMDTKQPYAPKGETSKGDEGPNGKSSLGRRG